MNRRLFLLLPVLLVLGTATTLGVAWACAAWVVINVTGPVESVQIAEEVWETTQIKRRFGHTQVSFLRGRVYYSHERNGLIDLEDSGCDDFEYRQWKSVGWPWRCLQCSREVAAFYNLGEPEFGYFRQRQHPTPIEHGIELPFVPAVGTLMAPIDWRALPYAPLWLGLIANTVLYGTVWWLIIIGTIALRQYVRRRRGLCPQCAYDLRGDLPRGCPECGWGRAGTMAVNPPSLSATI